MQAPLFSCRVSFLGFSWGGIFRECGRFFYDCCDWGFWSWEKLQEHALCFCKTVLMFSVKLILHTAECVTGFSFGISRICLVAEARLCGEQWAVSSALRDGHNWPVRRSKNNGERRLQKTSALWSHLLSHQTDLPPAGACHKALEGKFEKISTINF